MAYGDVTVSRLGQINAATGSYDNDNKLFLKVFANEVLTQFEESNVMKALHTIRTISSGKSAQFPVTGIATAKYHQVGEDILESTSGYSSQIKHAEKVINIDDVLLAATFIANIDEMKNHYDVRSIYSKELGKALAKRFDIATMKTLIAAARTNKTVDDGFAGTQIELGATNSLSQAGEVIEIIQEIAQKLDENDVPSEDRFIILNPEKYYTLVGADTNAVSFTTEGSGVKGAGYSRLENPLLTTGVTNLATAQIAQVAGINIYKSNHLNDIITEGNAAAVATGDGAGRNEVFDNTLPHDGHDGNFDATGTGYNGNFSKTLIVGGHKSAIGTVKLMDLTTESEYIMTKQGTALVAKYAMGHGVLRPECAVEVISYTA